MSLQWITDRFAMRSATNAGQQIRRYRITPKPLSKLPKKWTLQSRNVA